MINLSSLSVNHTIILQWIPSHCNIFGNEAADALAKEGTSKDQTDRSTTYPDVKAIIKAKQWSLWHQKHPSYNSTDPFYLLTRQEQVSIFRLRTGHNRLRHNLFTKFKVGDTDQCPCRTGVHTAEHILQHCPNHSLLRDEVWPHMKPMSQKLYGSLEDLRCTAAFIARSGETEKNN